MSNISDTLFLFLLIMLIPIAIVVGAKLGDILVKITSTTGYHGHPKCIHCGKRSLVNNSDLFMQHSGQPWMCTRCRKPNRQVLVAATVRVKK